MTKNDGKIAWLAVLQGFSMLLVVLGHVTLSNEFMDPRSPLTAAMERVIYSFHMPLFIFVSGWLFCLTCLSRDVSYRATMRKKLIRLGIPFAGFTLIATVVKLVLSQWVRRPVDSRELIDTFVLFSSNPLGEMWFIIVLLILMTFYPVYRWLMRNDALIWGLCGALALYAVVPDDITYFQLSRVIRMSVYFMAGIICCRYSVIERYASRWYVFAVALMAFLCINIMELPDGTVHPRILYVAGSAAGIAVSVSLCCGLAAIRPGAFGSFRDWTFQIFLMGIFFQMAVRLLYGKIGGTVSWAYPVLFAISVAAGIYLPVMIARFVSARLPFVRRLIGL